MLLSCNCGAPFKDTNSNHQIQKHNKMSGKKFTWGDLKSIINELPTSELEKQVVWWGEEVGGTINKVLILDEDYVATDYGCEPASVQEYEEGDEEYPIAYEKGTPILMED
jgi:hypothetical protein